MLTADAVDSYVAGVRGTRRLIDGAVAELFAQLADEPNAAAAQLVVTGPLLAELFADIVADIAGDFYSEVMDTDPVLAPAPESERVEASMRWAAAPLFGADQDRRGAAGRVRSAVDRFATNVGHETVFMSGESDRRQPRFARVPVGVTCAFCRVMSSRGAVYLSEATAKFRVTHDDCDCKVVPVSDTDSLPYDRDALYAEYESAAAKAGSSNLKAVTAAMRESAGGS